MMNELADRLVWGRHLCGMTPTEAEAVLKALRFAGYMERLRNDPIFYMQEVISTGEIEIVTSAGRVSDKCIYSAARKAVEELEKGEGDARHKD